VGTTLSVQEQDAVAAAVMDSRAPATQLAYAGAMRRFTDWAIEHGHPVFPTSPDVVAAHLLYLADARGLSMSTINTTVSSLSAAHADAGFRDPTKHRGTTATVASLRRRLGVAPRHQSRAVDLRDMKAM